MNTPSGPQKAFQILSRLGPDLTAKKLAGDPMGRKGSKGKKPQVAFPWAAASKTKCLVTTPLITGRNDTDEKPGRRFPPLEPPKKSFLRLTRSATGQETLHTDIFIQIPPVDTLATPHETKNAPAVGFGP